MSESTNRMCEGRVAIVTGAGRGIGREHALMLAEQGARVIVNDLGGDEAGGGEVGHVPSVDGCLAAHGLDLGDDLLSRREVRAAGAMVEQAVDTWGRLDILINNAGILRDRMVFSMSEDDWDAVIAVHLKGTFAPSHHAAAYWRNHVKGGGEPFGRIINTASPSGIYGNVGQTNYGAAKAGIASFSIIAAQELVRYGVTVNCLAPTAVSRLTIPLMGGEENLSESAMEAMSPRWIALIATWLCSEEAQNVTGRMFDIRGRHLGIAEGWHLGPTAEQPDEPGELGSVVEGLMQQARLNADMSGGDHEGLGFPSQGL